MPALADRWRPLAPDYPGFGYLRRLCRPVRQVRHRAAGRAVRAVYDYGSQIGLRPAIRAPWRVAGLVIQNGDIYEDELGPKYDSLRAYWKNPTPEGRRELLDAVSEEGFRAEFIGEVDDALVDRVPPDLWKLSWSLMMPQLRDIKVGLMDGLRENLDRFPRYQAYLRDLPSAELHLFDTGHWALETQLSKIVPVIGNFLDCVHR